MDTTDTTRSASGSGSMTAPRSCPEPAAWRRWAALVFIVIVTVAMAGPLLNLCRYALDKDLHSHIVLIPFIVGYLVHLKRDQLAAVKTGSSVVLGTILLAGGAACLAWSRGWLAWPFGADAGGEGLSSGDRHSLAALAWVVFAWAGGFLFLGRRWMGAAIFPAFFLIFFVPLPDAFIHTIENWLVLGSAEATALLLDLTGTTNYREGTIFQLSTITLEVARECSGIRSSYVLFITSILASHLLLDTTWRRIVLVAFVIPLGIFRNGLRILVIALLCVHVGPHMIDSIVHKRGGPAFFAISLVPLFILLWWLRRGERRRERSS